MEYEGTLQIEQSLPSLDQFTLCNWMRFTNHSGDHTIFTYSREYLYAFGQRKVTPFTTLTYFGSLNTRHQTAFHSQFGAGHSPRIPPSMHDDDDDDDGPQKKSIVLFCTLIKRSIKHDE